MKRVLCLLEKGFEEIEAIEPLLLHDAGVIKGERITAHDSTYDELPEITGGRVEHEANLLTSRGAGTAIDFGLTFVKLLVGEEAAVAVSQAIMA